MTSCTDRARIITLIEDDGGLDPLFLVDLRVAESDPDRMMGTTTAVHLEPILKAVSRSFYLTLKVAPRVSCG